MRRTPWARAAAELVKSDFKAVSNRFAKSPGSLAVGALVPFSIVLFLLFPFGLFVGGTWGQARQLVVAYAIPIAILWSFGPPRWSPAAQVLLPSMPVSHRAVFVHTIVRILLAFSVGYFYALMPLVIFLLPLNPEAGVTLLITFWPLAAAIAVALTIGTSLWAILGSAPAGIHWAVRGGLVVWFGYVGLAGMAGATVAEQLNLFGPLAAIAQAAVPLDAWFVQFFRWEFVVRALLLLAMCTPALLLPVRHFAPRALAEGTVLRRSAGGGGEVRQRFARPDFGVRRVFRPFNVPEGTGAALGYLARQWLKVFLWMVVLYAAYVVLIAAATALAPPTPRMPGPPPDPTDPAVFWGTVYILVLAGIALARSPEAFEWLAGLRGRRSKAFALPIPRQLRIGPPALSFKRWPQLQTMPFSPGEFERAFLAPMAILLTLQLALTVLLVGSAANFRGDWPEVALFLCGSELIIVGGALIASRSSRRFARDHDPALDGIHAVSAALWGVGSVPLLLSGLVWFLSRNFRGEAKPVGSELALLAFVLAAVLMPSVAYMTALNRVVAVERRYDHPSLPLFLMLGTVAFFFLPVGLLITWWLPDV